MKRALCIGINDYPGTENDLSGCRNDAEDWAAALRARGFETRTLIDSAASGAAIRAGITELVSTAAEDDAVVITYSGHGTWVPDTNGDEPDHRDEAICPHDIAENGPLLDDELHDLFTAAAPGVRTVLISDSCHAGTLTRFNHPIGDHPSRTRFLPPSTFLTAQQRLRAAQLPPTQAPPRRTTTPEEPEATQSRPATAPERTEAAQSRPATAPERTEGAQPQPAPTPEGAEGAPPRTATASRGIEGAPLRPVTAPPAPRPTLPALRPATEASPRATDTRPTVLLLAGCGDTEYSYDATFNDRPNGAFTYVALTTLSTLPPTATYRDWLRAIRTALPSQDYPQTPALQATRPQLAWPLLS